MAILMTTSYQLISTISLTYGQIRTYAKYSSQNRENNFTTYQLQSRYYIPSQNNVSFSSATAILDGSQKDYGYTTFYKGETIIQEIERTITHNQDGTSPTKNVATSWTASFGGSGNTNADIIFPKIQRYPQITGADDFSDVGNPTMTFTNQGLYPVRVKMKVGNNEIVVEDINQTATEHTFNLTQAQRETLRNLTPNSNTMSVRFVVCAMNGNTELSNSHIDKIMTIVNNRPTLTFTMQETNQKVIDVLGGDTSAGTIIKNASKVLVSVNPVVYKGATISEVRITNSSNNGDFKEYVVKESPYEAIVDCVGGNFVISVVDSRGNIGKQILIGSAVEYEKIKINSFDFVRENPTSSNIILNLDSNYNQITEEFTNVPVVKWKLDDGSYNTIPSSEYNIDTTNNKLIINDYELTNALTYTSRGTFYIEVSDLLTSDSNKMEVTQGVPTMDLGEHDLQVNGDIYVADTDGTNPKSVSTKIEITTNGNAVKTGRIIDGQEEYVKRIRCNNLGASGVEKTYPTGIDVNNSVITDINVIGFSDSNNYYPFPNNDSGESKIQLKNNGNLSITIYSIYWENTTAYAEIKYYAEY